MNLLQPMTIAGLLATGMGVALLGSVKMPLARRLEIDEARVGGLVSLFGFTMIPVILSVGFLTDLLGRQGVLVGGSLLMAASLFVLSGSRSYRSALSAVLMLSAAWAALINVVNVLTPPSFLEPAEIPERIAFATNLANVFFGLGAFLTPLGIAWLLNRAGFRTALLLPGVLVLLPALLSLGVDFDELASSADPGSSMQDAGGGMTELLSDPVMWLCAMALFFYGPLEASMAAWTTTYLSAKGITEGLASGLLSGFWLTFMLARLLTALALPSGYEAPFIASMSLACVVVLAGIVWSAGRGTAILLVLAAGFVFGPVFPTIIAVLLSAFDESLHGRAVGLFFAVGGIGWTTIPILIGTYAKRTTLERGFLIAVGSAVALSAVAGMLVFQLGMSHDGL